MSTSRPEGLHGLGELLGNVATDIQDLVRGEIRLARSELDQKLDRVIMAAVWLLGGALIIMMQATQYRYRADRS